MEAGSASAVIGTAPAAPSDSSQPLPVVVASPELRALLRKLALLEALCAQKRFRAAALLLSNVQAQLGSFDPLRYFPALFSGYLRALVTHGDALTTAQKSTQDIPSDLRLTALRQLLHCDLDLFALLAQEVR